MKNFFALVISILLNTCCLAQLHINTKAELNYDHDIILKFITDNHFDYAVLGWARSNQFNPFTVFNCLVQQDSNWYLVRLSKSRFETPKILDAGILVQQVQLSTRSLDSIKKSIKLDSAFKYSQADIDKLPKSCSYIKNGKNMGLYSVDDAGTSFLLEYTDKKVKILSFYAAGMYLSACYPYVVEFGVLKGLVDTNTGLYRATQKLKIVKSTQ